jgi:hypothetical protein
MLVQRVDVRKKWSTYVFGGPARGARTSRGGLLHAVPAAEGAQRGGQLSEVFDVGVRDALLAEVANKGSLLLEGHGHLHNPEDERGGGVLVLMEDRADLLVPGPSLGDYAGAGDRARTYSSRGLATDEGGGGRHCVLAVVGGEGGRW